MKNLAYLEIFAAVAQQRSFSKAGIALGMPKSTVSRNVKALEEDLGVQLIQRDPRRFELTDPGIALLQSSERLLRQAEDAFDEVSNSEVGLRGSITISTTADLAQIYLADAVSNFSIEHPSIKIKIDVNPSMADLIKERIDFAIRVGPLNDSRLYARKLQDRQMGFFASVDYLNKHGRPKSLAEMNERPFLFTSRIVFGDVTLEPLIQANNMTILREFIVQGVGIGLMDEQLISAEKKQGKIIQLFTNMPAPKASIYLVFPNKKLSKRVSKLVKLIMDSTN